MRGYIFGIHFRIYLSCAECIDGRGVLVAAGAGKALLNLALDKNTDDGKHAASQALAKLTITADPRLTFPGERVSRWCYID